MNLPNIYDVKKVNHPKDIMVSVPGSKSITNRALLIAAMANGKSSLKGVLFSDDSRHFLAALMDLGFAVTVDEANCQVTIEGMGGKIPKEKASINVGSAGTAARFLTAFLALSSGSYEIDSSQQMKKRPMEELLLALEELGASFQFQEEPYHFPFEITNKGIAKYEVTIDVEKSSQFLSALLIVSVLFPEDFLIHVSGSHGMAYVEMTLAMMEQFGVKVQRLENQSFLIPKDAKYNAMDYQIEPDISAACYFYAMSPILKVKAFVKNVHANSLQGDIAFLDVLTKMGCELEEKEDGMEVSAPKEAFLGGEFDLSSFSDQALTLSALAVFAASPVTITGISHIKYQECDRIHAICSNLNAMGIEVEKLSDGVKIYPAMPKGAVIHTFEDHRVAMSYTLCGLAADHIQIENPGCCRKTFENYYDVLETTLYDD